MESECHDIKNKYCAVLLMFTIPILEIDSYSENQTQCPVEVTYFLRQRVINIRWCITYFNKQTVLFMLSGIK